MIPVQTSTHKIFRSLITHCPHPGTLWGVDDIQNPKNYKKNLQMYI